jgi:hypothetical protein
MVEYPVAALAKAVGAAAIQAPKVSLVVAVSADVPKMTGVQGRKNTANQYPWRLSPPHAK